MKKEPIISHYVFMDGHAQGSKSKIPACGKNDIINIIRQGIKFGYTSFKILKKSK